MAENADPNVVEGTKQARSKPAFGAMMSPTDSLFSPCTQKLASRRGARHLMAIRPSQLRHVFRAEESQLGKETHKSPAQGQ